MKHSPNSNEPLNEGIISYATDLVMAFRIVKILYQDWTKTKAYELGVIDANGVKVRSPETFEEKSAYSPFIRLVFRLKRLLAMVPGGDSKLGSLAAAYALLREDEELDISTLTKEQLDELFEDAPVNVSGGAAGTDVAVGKPLRRSYADKEKLADCTVFDVESKTYSKCKSAKQRYDRWDKYIDEDDGDAGKDILQYARSYPGKGIVLREKGTGAHVFLKTPK